MIENDLKRIADALEAIVAIVKGGLPETPKKGITAVPPPVPTTPVPPPPPVTTSPAQEASWPSSPEELSLMAQKIAQKMGPKTLEFTAWVTKELKGYGVETILTIPANKVIEMAVKLDAYAKERGING